MRLPVTVGDLARIALTVSADTACADLDMTFRGDAHLSCVVVSDGERLAHDEPEPVVVAHDHTLQLRVAAESHVKIGAGRVGGHS